jgi:hypothetical protein
MEVDRVDERSVDIEDDGLRHTGLRCSRVTGPKLSDRVKLPGNGVGNASQDGLGPDNRLGGSAHSDAQKGESPEAEIP